VPSYIQKCTSHYSGSGGRKRVATVRIGELSPSKFIYETLEISKGFIKFSECQVPCANLNPLFKTFW